MKKFKTGDKYYYLTLVGDISSDVWCDTDVDNMLVEVGNIFKTKEEATFMLEKIKVYNELKRYADEHNEREIKWKKDMCRDKCSSLCKFANYFAYYGNIEGEIRISDNCISQDIGQIYFTSEEIAKNAIKVVGADRIKKYLFEVE